MEPQTRPQPQIQPQAGEPHEQFLQRAGEVFPVDAALAWTRFERVVFNHLMARLIFNHGYANISDAMLLDAFEEMQRVVHGYPGATRSTLSH